MRWFHCRPVLCALLTLTLAFAMAGVGPSGWGPLPVTATVKAGVIEEVSMKRLGILEESIYLPTVSAKRDLVFYAPKNARLSSASYLHLTFQHAYTLDPSRSWLQVVVNDQVVKQIALGPSNASSTTVKVPLPVGSLKLRNKLSFRVRQHYKAKCEDPTDASLWTQILPTTRLVLDYVPIAPKLDLGSYPFPVIDTFSYTPARVQFLLPGQPLDAHMEAMAIVNTHLAMKAPKEPKVYSTATTGTNVQQRNADWVLVGTGQEVQQFLSSLGVSAPPQLSGGQWQGVGNGDGAIALMRHPYVPTRTMLLVSGNDAGGVVKAAQMLSKAPRDLGLRGAFTTTRNMKSPLDPVGEPNRSFIANETRSFHDLGYQTTAVYKLHAPPINLDVPVTKDFTKGGDLYLNLVYSYSMMLNPRYSSLEIRINDRSVANVPLTEPYGQKRATARIFIPPDVLLPNSRLVAQFHLLPDKYGYCKGEYIDIAHGILHQDSSFEVVGAPSSYLPKLDLFSNSVGYPYTSDNTLRNVWVHLTNPADLNNLQTLLSVTNHLGRHLRLKNGFIQLRVSAQPGQIPGDRHLLAISSNGELPESLSKRFRLVRLGQLASYKSQNETFMIGQGARIQTLEQAGDEGQASTHLAGFNTPYSLMSLAKAMEATHLEQAIAQEPIIKVRQLAQLNRQENRLRPADEPKNVVYVQNPSDTGLNTQMGGNGSGGPLAGLGGGGDATGGTGGPNTGVNLTGPLKFLNGFISPVVAFFQTLLNRIGLGKLPWIPILLGVGLLLVVISLLRGLGRRGGPPGGPPPSNRNYY